VEGIKKKELEEIEKKKKEEEEKEAEKEALNKPRIRTRHWKTNSNNRKEGELDYNTPLSKSKEASKAQFEVRIKQ